jgi:hypothetical protein
VSGVHAREAEVPFTRIWFAVVDGVPPNVQVRDRVVDFAPFVVGFPFTVTVQVAPAPASVPAPQVSAVIVKFVVSVIEGAEHPVAVAVPEFVKVKTWVPDEEPRLIFPKSKVSGAQARTGAIPFTRI